MKRWVVGGVLFISLGLNVMFVATVAGKHAGQQFKPGRIVMERLKELPPEQRKAAREVLKQQRAKIKETAEELRRSREEVFAYIASEDYERGEAERRLTELRGKTAVLQEQAQHTMLDMVEKLPPEQRAKFLEHRRGAMGGRP